MREAKVHSSWINVNAEYEEALDAFVQQLLGKLEGNLFIEDLRRHVRTIAWFGAYEAPRYVLSASRSTSWISRQPVLALVSMATRRPRGRG